MRIDFHTHIIPQNLPDFSSKFGQNRWPVMSPKCSCGADIMVSGKVFREISDQAWDPERRINDMNKAGVDMQVLSPIPVTFSYWAPVEEALEMSKIQNDFIAETVQAYPQKFFGLGTVPLQDTEIAIHEMNRCVNELNLHGIEIGTNVNGENLDSARLLPFFEKAAEWGIPLFIHPWETLAKDRTPRHNFMYTIGMPSETALAAASLIWSGVIEKYPNLKICFSHGGGSFPFILPRLDQGWNVWPDLRITEHPPSHYTSSLYFDALNYDPLNLQFLIDRFGIDKIMMGSDYPFLLQESPPGKGIDSLSGLEDGARKRLLGRNALEFLNIKEISH